MAAITFDGILESNPSLPGCKIKLTNTLEFVSILKRPMSKITNYFIRTHKAELQFLILKIIASVKTLSPLDTK